MHALLDSLLERTSRTFALAIPLLAEPRRSEVGLAYLLLRAADTLEDAASWTRDARVAALRRFADVLTGDGDGHDVRWSEALPEADASCRALLEALPLLLAEVQALPADSRAIVLRSVGRTVDGMAMLLGRASEAGAVRIASTPELREYCYAVAGIVGELLTELFLLDVRLRPGAEALRAHALHFGEALQLVNILKDAAADARDGRTFLADEAMRRDAFELATSGLSSARRYVTLLAEGGADRGTVAFTSLPVLLAEATLARIARDGPGAKLSRGEVGALVGTLHAALDAGATPFGGRLAAHHTTVPGVA